MKDHIYHTKQEGGIIEHSYIHISQENQKRNCEAQALNYITPSHSVVLSDDNITIKAKAVFFLDGTIWDAVLSEYRFMNNRKSCSTVKFY